MAYIEKLKQKLLHSTLLVDIYFAEKKILLSSYVSFLCIFKMNHFCASSSCLFIYLFFTYNVIQSRIKIKSNQNKREEEREGKRAIEKKLN
jgi:ABC-type transport system involved in Fe-S cluster assembly fused permease/ATPase subunit